MSQLFNLVTVGGAVVKIHLPLQETQETWVRSLGREDPGRRKWQPTPIFLPGKFHGQRSLVGYSPWGCKELDMTDRLISDTHTCTQIQVEFSWFWNRQNRSLAKSHTAPVLPARDPRLTSVRPACFPPLNPPGLLIPTHICGFHYHLPWMTPNLYVSPSRIVCLPCFQISSGRATDTSDLQVWASLSSSRSFSSLSPGTSLLGCTPRSLPVCLSSSHLCLTHSESPHPSRSTF